jgi:hypothetical protein
MANDWWPLSWRWFRRTLAIYVGVAVGSAVVFVIGAGIYSLLADAAG